MAKSPSCMVKYTQNLGTFWVRDTLKRNGFTQTQWTQRSHFLRKMEGFCLQGSGNWHWTFLVRMRSPVQVRIRAPLFSHPKAINRGCSKAAHLCFYNLGTFWVRVLFQYPGNSVGRAFFHAWQQVIVGPHRQSTVRVSESCPYRFNLRPRCQHERCRGVTHSVGR